MNNGEIGHSREFLPTTTDYPTLGARLTLARHLEPSQPAAKKALERIFHSSDDPSRSKTRKAIDFVLRRNDKQIMVDKAHVPPVEENVEPEYQNFTTITNVSINNRKAFWDEKVARDTTLNTLDAKRTAWNKDFKEAMHEVPGIRMFNELKGFLGSINGMPALNAPTDFNDTHADAIYAHYFQIPAGAPHDESVKKFELAIINYYQTINQDNALLSDGIQAQSVMWFANIFGSPSNEIILQDIRELVKKTIPSVARQYKHNVHLNSKGRETYLMNYVAANKELGPKPVETPTPLEGVFASVTTPPDPSTNEYYQQTVQDFKPEQIDPKDYRRLERNIPVQCDIPSNIRYVQSTFDLELDKKYGDAHYLVSIAMASASNPQEQSQLYYQLAKMVVNMHERDRGLFVDWLNTQTRQRGQSDLLNKAEKVGKHLPFTPFAPKVPRSEKEGLNTVFIDYFQTQDLRQPEEMRLLKYMDRAGKDGMPIIDPKQTLLHLNEQMKTIKDKLENDIELSDYEHRVVQFLSHSVDIGKYLINRKNARKTPIAAPLTLEQIAGVEPEAQSKEIEAIFAELSEPDLSRLVSDNSYFLNVALDLEPNSSIDANMYEVIGPLYKVMTNSVDTSRSIHVNKAGTILSKLSISQFGRYNNTYSAYNNALLLAVASISGKSSTEQAKNYAYLAQVVLKLHKNGNLMNKWLQEQDNIDVIDRTPGQLIGTTKCINLIAEQNKGMLAFKDIDGSYDSAATRALWKKRVAELQKVFTTPPYKLTPEQISQLEFLAYSVNIDHYLLDQKAAQEAKKKVSQPPAPESPVVPVQEQPPTQQPGQEAVVPETVVKSPEQIATNVNLLTRSSDKTGFPSKYGNKMSRRAMRESPIDKVKRFWRNLAR
ncbi:hypothetical protein HGB07_00170 [Candidatus Roizmanbacteria bacterium]|nr:hypothetical protein [Candidatus Roizmanbacteria bacterium]